MILESALPATSLNFCSVNQLRFLFAVSFRWVLVLTLFSDCPTSCSGKSVVTRLKQGESKNSTRIFNFAKMIRFWSWLSTFTIDSNTEIIDQQALPGCSRFDVHFWLRIGENFWLWSSTRASVSTGHACFDLLGLYQAFTRAAAGSNSIYSWRQRQHWGCEQQHWIISLLPIISNLLHDLNHFFISNYCYNWYYIIITCYYVKMEPLLLGSRDLFWSSGLLESRMQEYPQEGVSTLIWLICSLDAVKARNLTSSVNLKFGFSFCFMVISLTNKDWQ